MQKTIALRKIEYAVHEKPILQGVSFKCTVSERLCIFGENGAGKSTLLKIVCGQLDPDTGVVEKQGHIRFVYVPQEFDHSYREKTVEKYILDTAGEKLYKKIFANGDFLGFSIEHNMHNTCGSLSGGQQKIVALSVAFAVSPDFILLDEPENHLDIVSRMALISIMQEFRGGIIFISHDRLLIDKVATKVGELARGTFHVSDGGYEDYIEMKMQRLGGLQRAYDAESKRIKQLSSTISILRQKAIRGKEISAYQRAKAEFDALREKHKAEGRPDDVKTRIRIADNGQGLHMGKLLCRIKDVMFKYDGAKSRTFQDVHLDIRSGDKIVLLGRNGSGKSTFLKCLTNDLAPTAGSVVWADGISWAYFDQHALFDPEETPIDVVTKKLNCMVTEAQAALGAMKFDTARMTTPTKHLSGGERMRLRFALVFGQKPHFILLDEPTNHIDEVTWEILLQACVTSKSSILLVTHDYEFIKAFNPTVFWMVHGQKIEARYKDLDVLLEEISE